MGRKQEPPPAPGQPPRTPAGGDTKYSSWISRLLPSWWWPQYAAAMLKLKLMPTPVVFTHITVGTTHTEDTMAIAMDTMAIDMDILTDTEERDRLTPLLTPLLIPSLLLMLILLQTPMLSLVEYIVMVIAVATTLTVVTMVIAMGIMATPPDTTTVASDQLTPYLTPNLLLMLILLQTPMLSLVEDIVMVIAVATTLTVVTMVTAMGIMATPTDTATVDNNLSVY